MYARSCHCSKSLARERLCNSCLLRAPPALSGCHNQSSEQMGCKRMAKRCGLSRRVMPERTIILWTHRIRTLNPGRVTSNSEAIPLAWFVVPAQPVDATPSNTLIRQCFPGRGDLFGCPRSKPSQGSVPADLTLTNDLTFVFNVSRVQLECCVDLLRPPG